MQRTVIPQRLKQGGNLEKPLLSHTKNEGEKNEEEMLFVHYHNQ